MERKAQHKTIFEYEGRKYECIDILTALRKVGIKDKDTIFVHSDVGNFGKISTWISKEKYLDAFLDSFKEAVGRTGTIIMPTFTYSFCNGELFDLQNTPSTVGVFTEYFRKQKGVIRSIDPIFSVAAFGSLGTYFTNVGTNCFGENSIFDKLYKKNVKLVFLGDTFDITYMHYIEQNLGVSYRSIKEFSGEIKMGDTIKKYIFEYNVRPIDQSVEYNLEKVASFLTTHGVLKKTTLGHSMIRMVTAEDAYTILYRGLQGDKYLLRNKNDK